MSTILDAIKVSKRRKIIYVFFLSSLSLSLYFLINFSKVKVKKGRKIYIHAGVNDGRDTEKFLQQHDGYIPYLFEPNPIFSSKLEMLANEYGGEFHKKAAWITDGDILTFNMNRGVWKNGVGGGLYKPTVTKSGSLRYISKLTKKTMYGRFDDSNVSNHFSVTTIDLSRFIKDNFSLADEIVLRLDVEGAEYLILRKFFSDGIHCIFKRIEYEAHAMFSSENYKYKSFDAVFPWLVSACNTEIELEALHLGGSGLLEDIFDKSKMSKCEACELPPITEVLEPFKLLKPGWWLFEGTQVRKTNKGLV